MRQLTTTKTERLEMRLTRSQKKRIAEAARLQGKSLSDFATATLQEAAVKVIEEQNTIRLNAKAAEDFVRLLQNPPAPNRKLMRAGQHYRQWARKRTHKA